MFSEKSFSHRRVISNSVESKCGASANFGGIQDKKGAVIDEAVIVEFFLTSSFRREEDESAGLDREYWERVNQVPDPVEIF